MSEDDLCMMYRSLGKDSVLLWCDGKSQNDQSGSLLTSRKRKIADSVDKHQEKIEDLDDIYKSLKEKHRTNYTNPRLCLWARLIEAGSHESTEDPPKIPVITGVDSLAKAISNAAVTFAHAFKPSDISVSGASSSLVVQTTPPRPVQVTSSVISGISPGRITDLRIKKLQELKELQKFLEENVINKEELESRKH